MQGQSQYSSLAHGNADIVDSRQEEDMSTASTTRPDSCDGSSIPHNTGCDRCGKFRNPFKYPQPQSYAQYSDYKVKELDRKETGLSSSLSKRFTTGPKRSASVHFLRDWWLELISCIFLLGGLVAIIVTAHVYQDNPLPNLPEGISINSVLAIYVVILKAAMLLILAQGLSHLKWTWFQKTRPLNDLARYDNASRGPLGSLWLLFSLRGRDIVSSIGALLILAAVILDPMAQQVIRYYNCPQTQPGINGTLPRTNAYMEVGLHVGAGKSTILRPLLSAINGGVFVPGANVDFDCPSGNCTFPNIYHTVGYSSNCVDISDQLSFNNVSIVQNTTMSQYDTNGNIVQVPITNNYTTLETSLPSGLNTSYNEYSLDVTYMAMQYNSSNFAVEVILGPQTANAVASHPPYCDNSTLTDAEVATNWDCRGWGAARCTLQPAVFNIQSVSVASGKLSESVSLATILDSQHAGFADNSFAVADVSCLNSSQKDSLIKAGYIINTNTTWLPYNISLDLATGSLASGYGVNITNATRDIVPKECIYQIYTTTASSINYFFVDFFLGQITRDGSEYTGPSIMQQFYNDRGMTFSSVDKMFTNITNSMTTYIRQNGFANNSSPALGEVIQVDTCIRVRWPLIAYPAALTLVTIVFFIAMVVQTKKGQQGVHHDFKSSPLALLFHGLEDGVQRRLERVHVGESNEVTDLKHEAKDMWVRLRPTGKGWRFVGSEKGV